MHSLKLSTNTVNDNNKKKFISASLEDVQKRIRDAEENNNFSSHKNFWSKIDKKIQNL
jgi:hypothetical protein